MKNIMTQHCQFCMLDKSGARAAAVSNDMWWYGYYIFIPSNQSFFLLNFNLNLLTIIVKCQTHHAYLTPQLFFLIGFLRFGRYAFSIGMSSQLYI